MSDANYKNRLRKRLDHHSTPMNLESEWAALEARRPTKKKRPFIWFWFGSVAVILLFSVWYNTQDVILPFSTTTKNDSATIEKQSSSSLTPTKDNKTNTQTVTIKEEQFANNTNTFSSNSNNNKFQYQNIQSDLDNNKIKTKSQKEDETNIEISKNVAPIITSKELQKISKDLKNNFIRTTSLPNKGIFLLPLSSPILDLSKADRKNINIKKDPVWAIGFKAAYGRTFRQLDALNPTKKSLINRRNEFETTLDNWNFTINLSRMINQNWLAEFGIGFSKSTDRFQNNFSTTNFQPLSDQVISIIYNRDGTTDLILGDVIAEETMTTRATYYHYSKSAFAQIIVGRKVLFNDRWGCSFSSGLNYSLFSHKSGTIFKDDSANTYKDLSHSNYRKSGLINLLVQAEVYYLITKNWEVSFGFQANSSLNNSFQNNSDFLEKRKVGGLQFGFKNWF